MKKILSLFFVMLLVCSSFNMVACKKKVADTPETLQVYLLDIGYGTQWCSDMLNLFKEQEWVKEKYPNLIIPAPTINDMFNFAETQFNSGSKNINTYDILFSSSLNQFTGPNGDIEDITESVYNSSVPNENIKWMDKANSSYNISNKYIDVTDSSSAHYYSASWAGGMNSIIYNETILNSFGLKVPNTTNEFIQILDIIKQNQGQNNGKYNKGHSLIQSKDAHYFDNLFPTWWAQYEGVENYINFYSGIDENRYSADIFGQVGRQKSLEVFESVLKYDKGYLNPTSFTSEFMANQTAFLQGNGVFHANGDWFTSEMSSIIDGIKAEEGKIDTFKMMRLPIISALGEQLGITDSELSAIVEFVDGSATSMPNFTSNKGYSADDVLKRVKEARSIVYTDGPNHMSVIPKYAEGKAVAIDFLRFMATDIALESYIKSTAGASLPFEYNLIEKNNELYNSISDLQKGRHEYFNSPSFEIYNLPSIESFPLVKYGGLTPFMYVKDYYVNFSKKDGVRSVSKYMEDTQNYWTEKRWDAALLNAGISK